MATRKLLYTLLLASVLSLALALSACTAPAAAPADGGGEESTEQPAADTEDKPVIKLAENPWSAAALNTAIARILLEEQLGYEVEVVAIGESAQWPALASGDLSASLEVWPSGHGDNVAEYIDGQGLVENGGLLGPVGKIGWYMPSYLLDANPDLATADGLASADAASG